MKTPGKLLLLLFFIFLLSPIFSQTNKGFTYQAVARDNAGGLLLNTSVNLRFQIRQGNASGTILYQEVHTPTTNEHGLIQTIIGKGTQEVGDFTTLDWGSADYFLTVELNGAGIDTSQLEAVPYAKVATSMNLENLQDVGSLSPAPNQVLQWNGSEWTAANDAVDDADADPNNELQSLSLSGANLSISSGNSVTLPTGTTYTPGTGISISGNVISNSAPDQTVSLTGSGATNITGTYPNFTISSTDNVNDADFNPSNELQSLALSGNSLSISSGNSVTLPTGTTYSPGTGISISGSVISNSAPDQIVSLTGSGATSITGTYPNFTVSSTDNVDDADANPSNEIQSLSLSGNNLSISSGNSVSLPTGTTYTAGTGISISGSVISNSAPDQTVSLTGSGATSITGTYPNFTVSSTDNVNDADASTTNEIQTLSLSGNTLSLSLGGGSTSLASFASKWDDSGSNIYYNTGKVGIGDNSPVATLTVGNGDKFQVNGNDGDVVFNDDQGSIRFANANGSNAPMMYMFGSGTNNSTRMFLAHSPNFQTWGLQYNDTLDAFTFLGGGEPVLNMNLSGQQRIGVGTFSPEAKLHVSYESSTVPNEAHIKLTETENDYARLRFDNTSFSEFWDVAGIANSTLTDAKLNFFYSATGNIMTIRGNGSVGINDDFPGYPLEIDGDGASRIIYAYNTGQSTSGTSSIFGVRTALSQVNTSGNVTLYNLYGRSSDSDAYLTLGAYGYAFNASNFNYGVYGVAPTTNGYAVYAAGNTYTTGTYTSSDAKLKKEILPLSTGLSTIMSLSPKSYQYDQEQYGFMNLPEGEQYGFLAQELEKVLPTLVKRSFHLYDEEDPNKPEGHGLEFKAVNYTSLIPILVSGMQEQQQVIEEQEKKIEDLEARLKAIEDMLKK